MPDLELICHRTDLSHFFRGRYQDLYRGTDNPHFPAARKDPRPRPPWLPHPRRRLPRLLGVGRICSTF